ELHRRSEGEAALLGQALADHRTQAGYIDSRILAREILSHLVGLVIDRGLFLEVRGHHLDHAGDQITLAGFEFDGAPRDQPANEVAGQRVDFSFSDHCPARASCSPIPYRTFRYSVRPPPGTP